MNVDIEMETKKLMLKKAPIAEEFLSFISSIYRIRSDW